MVITGASSGIGAALAAHYARPGVTLGLTGRDAARLASAAAGASRAGAYVQQGVFDVRDRRALSGFLSGFDADHPIDLLIANAGILEGRQADGTPEDAEAARRVIDTNLLGAIDTVLAVTPGMTARGRGHIVLVSSIAGIAPVADAPAYSASKAGLLAYGRALRASFGKSGVRVCVVCPGYVASAMTDSHIGHQPGKITASAAARLIAHGVARDRAVIGFPRLLYLPALITPFLPEAINLMATRNLRFHVARRG